ncbi:MAG: ATP-binding protein, partial [Pseudomonadota bacterium]|nr:ATP-binding protein [Pseudomonadota bacterium]
DEGALPTDWLEQADALIGREEDIARTRRAITAALDRHGDRPPVLWLGGRPGIGKSALLAKVAALCAEEGQALVIPWRFKAQDIHGTNPDQFYRHAIARLSAAAITGLGKLKPAQDANGRMSQFGELLDQIATLELSDKEPPSFLLFVIDAMDEAAIIDPDFVQRPLSYRRRNVVWLCSGRAEGTDTLSAKSGPIFSDSDGMLPPMSETDIRSMLLSRLGSLGPEIASWDQDDGDGVSNRLAKQISQHGEGLPLYVDLVVKDLQTGKLEPWSVERRLPRSLEDYYRDLLERQGMGKAPIVKTRIMTLAAVSYAPITKDLLVAAFTRSMTIEPEEAGIVDEILAGLRGMLRPERWQGRIGYLPYHKSLGDHIREDRDGVFLSEIPTARKSLIALASDWKRLSPGPAREYALHFGLRHMIEAKALDRLRDLLLETSYLDDKLSELGVEDLFDDLKRLPEKLPFSLVPYFESLLPRIEALYTSEPKRAAYWVNALGWISDSQDSPLSDAYRLSAKRYREAAKKHPGSGWMMATRLVRNAAWNLMSAGDLIKSAEAFVESTSVLEERLGHSVDIAAISGLDPKRMLCVVEQRVREVYCRIRALRETPGRLADPDAERQSLRALATELAFHKRAIGQTTSLYLRELCKQLNAVGIAASFTRSLLEPFQENRFADTPDQVVVSNEFDLWVADVLLDWLEREGRSYRLLTPKEYGNGSAWQAAKEIYLFGGPKAPHIGRQVADLFGDQPDFEKLFIHVEREEGFGKVFKLDGRPRYWLIAGNDEETSYATADLMRQLAPADALWRQLHD